jgi:prepilin-type N-terminal cleavage/methylation domain-containing protein
MRQALTSQDRRAARGAGSPDGFTFTELVVVLAVLALLTLLLLPALAGTKSQDKSAVCMSNLRQIYVGMMIYAGDNNDTFHNVGGGSLPNDGHWTANPNSTAILAPNDGAAYWGIAYYTNAGVPREVFRCPSAKIVDEWRDAGLFYPHEFWLTSTYGICEFLLKPYNTSVSSDPAPLKTTSFLYPSTKICVQDSVEQRPEGASDSIGLFPGEAQILTQWIGIPPGSGGMSTSYYSGYPFQWEWYRHDRRNQTLWLSGNVSKIPFTGYNIGIDYRYYTGEKPVIPIPGN